MKRITDRLYTFLKKPTALLLAVATFVSALVILPAQSVEGATYYVNFINNISKREELATTLLEGETIYTKKNVPNGYNYQTIPFVAMNTADNPIGTTSTNLGDGIVAKDAITSVGTNGRMIYNIRPQFSASLTKSDTGIIKCNTAAPPDTATIEEFSHTAEIINGKTVSITQNSSIKLSVTAATVEYEKDEDGNDTTRIKGQKSISFGSVVATGDLAGDYNGKSAIWTGKQSDGKYKITIQGVGSTGIDLLLSTSSTLPVMYAGSTFEISFSLQTIDPMQLTIISKQAAVNEISTAINTPTNLTDFVKLSSGDAQHSITKNFNLVSTYDDFNYKGFKIKWVWKPDNADDTNFVVINPPKPGADSQVVTITPQLNNISGNIEATVVYDKTGETAVSSTVVAKIPITVLGTGTKPQFKPMFSYTGQANGVPITDVPTKMDVNDGSHAGYNTFDGPYRFTGVINFGSGTQRAKTAKINVHYNQNGKADILVGRSTTPYVSGTAIENPSTDASSEGTIDLEFIATHAGVVTIEFIFTNANGTEFAQKTYTINPIVDNSPSKDSSFKDITLFGNVVTASDNQLVGDDDDTNGTNQDDIDNQAAAYLERFKDLYGGNGTDGVIPFGFKPEIKKYTLTVPFAVASVDVLPIYNNINAKSATVICGTTTKILNGKTDRFGIIKLPTDGSLTQIFFTGVAEDGSISSYEIAITRAPQSNVASLDSLAVNTYKDKKDKTLTPAFANDVYFYELSLPYALRGDPTTGGAKITAVSAGDWGEKPTFEASFLKADGTTANVPSTFNLFSALAGLFSGNKGEAGFNLQYNVTADGEIESTTEVKITVRSEDRKRKAEYIIRITIEDPSENNQIADLKTFQTDGVTEIPYVGGQTFNKVGRDFYIDIPFKTEKVWFSILPDDDKIEQIKMIYPDVYIPNILGVPQGKELIKRYVKKGEPIRISADVKYDPNKHDDTSEFIFEFEAQAENEHWTSQDNETYKLHINRLAANTDSRLESLEIVDIKDTKPLDEFKFNKVKFDYEVNVPYDTEEVVVTPVASKPDLSLVTVNGTDIKDGRLNKNISLAAGQTTVISVVVVPESGDKDKSTYTIKVKRQAPGTEARLIKLEVGGGEKMLPDPFVPGTLDYTVEIPKGTATFTITPTTYDKNATVTIDGKVAESGKPFGPITSVEATVKYNITVTAQDGKTQKKYTLTVTDYNLINKSDRAELINLKLNYADLKPGFQSGIDNYQIFLKPEAKKLELMPTASPKATIEVSAGSKKLSPYSGKYSTSVLGNKETITIKVTPESGKEELAKTYTFTVIKNDKKEQGAFKPITSDMVDYEKTDPIVIDITNYAVIDASVFNKLKTDYPDKTIIFSGNDYMFKIKGADIKELVPHTTQFDLAMQYTSPEESMVSQLLMASGNQWDWSLEPVYLYFDDHGALPAQMLLTVSLGREYQNSPLFWNYFNEERDRIDYYGYINSNSKGTITVPVTHLSTYMVTPRPVYNSEDKTGMGFGWIQNATSGSGTLGGGSGNGNVTGDKDVPQTGVK